MNITCLTCFKFREGGKIFVGSRSPSWENIRGLLFFLQSVENSKWLTWQENVYLYIGLMYAFIFRSVFI